MFGGTKYGALSIFCMIWSVIQATGGIAFVVLQIILTKNYRVKEAFQPPKLFRQRTQLDLDEMINDDENDDEEEDDVAVQLAKSNKSENGNVRNITDSEQHSNNYFDEYEVYREDAKNVGSKQQKYRLIATKLRYVSFAVEGIVAASVILNATFSTIIRIFLLH